MTNQATLFSDEDVQEAITELHAVINYNVGNRAVVGEVDGLNGYGGADLLNDTVTQVKFTKKLTPKQTKYCNTAMNSGSAVDIVEIARVMNMMDCNFDTGAKLYFTHGQCSYAILKTKHTTLKTK